MDWTLLSAVAALVTALVGLSISISTRRKNEGDAALSIASAAEKTVLMREKDIVELNAKVERLILYVEYLHQWIEEHTRGKKPMSLDDFVRKLEKTVPRKGE